MKTSKKNIPANKCMTKKFRINFLQKCIDWYWAGIERPPEWWLKTQVDMPRLIWCYDFGASRGLIDITYEWFKRIVLRRLYPENELYPEPRIPYKREWVDHGDGGTHYVKKPHHGIKDRVAFEAKKTWRERTGKSRDTHRPWRRGEDVFCKNLRNRIHRRRAKRFLHTEEYDNLHEKTWFESLHYDR